MCNYKGKRRKKIPIGCVQSFSSLLLSKKYFYNRSSFSRLVLIWLHQYRLSGYVHLYTGIFQSADFSMLGTTLLFQ